MNCLLGNPFVMFLGICSFGKLKTMYIGIGNYFYTIMQHARFSNCHNIERHRNGVVRSSFRAVLPKSLPCRAFFQLYC